MRKHRLPNPYSDQVYLVTDCTDEQYHAHINKKYPDYKGWINGEGVARMDDPFDHKEGEEINYVWISQRMNKTDQRLSVIHEAAHLVINLFHHAGIPIKTHDDPDPLKSTDEAFTYMLESFCAQMFKILKL